MRRQSWVALAMVVVCTSLVGQTQKQQPMSPEQQKAMDAWKAFMTPSEGHKAPNGMVGTFKAKVTMWQQADAPPQISTGTSVNTWVLGHRYIEQKFTGSFMNMPFEGIGFTGYDNGKKEYVGTWMDNFSTGMMTSTGTSSDNGKTYTFKSTMTDPMTGKDTPGETRVTVADADHHTMEMWSPGPDGKVYKMMQIEYSRKK